MREKFFLPATLVVCVIFFIGWYQFFYTATKLEILTTQLETRKLRELEWELEDLKVRHGDLSLLEAMKESELDEARKFLPTTLATDKFIDELYRAAESSRVSLTSVTAGEEISAEEIQAQILTVKAEANYISLMNFLREILDGKRLVGVEKISVSGANVLSCEMTFKIFATSSEGN